MGVDVKRAKAVLQRQLAALQQTSEELQLKAALHGRSVAYSPSSARPNTNTALPSTSSRSKPLTSRLFRHPLAPRLILGS